MRFVKLLAFGATLALGTGSALAALVTWNTTGNLAAGSGQACAGTQKCKTTFSGSNGTLTAKAYSTNSVYANTNAGAGSAVALSSGWIEAQIALYTGGIGIKNLVGGDSLEGSSPEHAVDNDQIHDVVVFELPSGSKWDPDSFKLGWLGADSDVQAWIGGNTSVGAGYDFRNVCFTGCGTSLANLGFTEIGTGFDNVPVNTNTPFNTNSTGRYLVMAGNLGAGAVTGFNDAFKISQISAFKVPAPDSILLLGLGLAVLAFTRARPLPRRLAARG